MMMMMMIAVSHKLNARRNDVRYEVSQCIVQ